MASDSDSDDTKVVSYHTPSDVAEREFVLKLIETYREMPELWNTNNEHYANRYCRDVALRRLCNDLKQYKPNYTTKDLKKKLNILRTNFNKERRRMRMRKTISPDDDPQPILWYYNDMKFLMNKEEPEKKNIADKPPAQTTSAPQSQNLIKKKISIVSEAPGLKRAKHDVEIIAKYWSSKLRKLSAPQRMYAEKIINDTLFEAELGTLTRHGVTFNTETEVWTHYSPESHSPVYMSPPS